MLKKYFEPGALFSYPAYRNLWISTILTILAMSAFPIALAVTVLDAGGTITTQSVAEEDGDRELLNTSSQFAVAGLAPCQGGVLENTRF